MEAEAKEEKQAWLDKVVVDHLDFKVDGYSMKDTPATQLARQSDILHDDPQRLALKQIRTLTSPNLGKDWGYTTTPASVINSGPYEDPQGNPLQRKENKKKFVTATAEILRTGAAPQDFVRYISGPAGQRTVFDATAKRKHTSAESKIAEPKKASYWNLPPSSVTEDKLKPKETVVKNPAMDKYKSTGIY